MLLLSAASRFLPAIFQKKRIRKNKQNCRAAHTVVATRAILYCLKILLLPAIIDIAVQHHPTSTSLSLFDTRITLAWNLLSDLDYCLTSNQVSSCATSNFAPCLPLVEPSSHSSRHLFLSHPQNILRSDGRLTGTRSKLALLYPPVPLPAQHRSGSPIKASSSSALHQGMDDNNRRRRQNEPPLHPTNSRYHQQQQQQQPVQDPSQQARRSMAGSSSERYRPAPLNTSPPTAARTGMGGSAGYSAYYQEPSAAGFSNTAGLQPNTMGYHQPPTDYTQDTRQTQGFASAYPMSSMYNVPQASGQNPVYDTSNQFAPRQPAGLQMMPTDVGAPFYQSEPTNATAASALQQQTAPTTQQASGVYQQGNADRNNMLNYPSNMGIATIGTQQPANPPQPDVTMEDSAEYPAAGGLDEAYASYQTALREIFQNIRNGALVTASESLLNISEWLLGHVGDLGKSATTLELSRTDL